MADEDACSEVGIDVRQELVEPQPPEKSKKRAQLEGWLNKLVRIKISDGRTLVGAFMCTDRDRNIILGSCQEFVGDPNDEAEDPRILGLAMVPGKHIVSIEIDLDHQSPHMFKSFP